jgi:nitrate/TMAO reductase-like tetraheme cytochrome c subunit
MSTPALGRRAVDAIRSLGPRALWWIAIAWVVVFVAAAGVLSWSGSSYVCSSCHEIEPAVNALERSPHSDVECPSCHEPLRPWYRFAETYFFRAKMYQRDTTAHTKNPEVIAVAENNSDARRVIDENCLRCHDLSRPVRIPAGIILDHAKHQRLNGSCVSCHKWTAHPPQDQVDEKILLMAQCYTCHSRKPGAKAPGRCTLCHTAAYTSMPSTHRERMQWLATHGETAKTDRRRCQMCHDDSFCTNCHVLPMPHPRNWARGDKPAHAVAATANPRVCEQCHGAMPGLCTMCHHTGMASTGAPWVSNHAPTIRQRGVNFCLTCHKEAFCFGCHGKPGGPATRP